MSLEIKPIRLNAVHPGIISGLVRAVFGLLLLLVFLKVMTSVSAIQVIDEQILKYIGEHFRSEEWNFFFIDLSGLGSMAVVTTLAVVSALFFLLLSDWAAAVHIGITTYGAFQIASAAKHWIDRPRPNVIPKLIQAGGMAFPSGHSVSAAAVYFTLAYLVARGFVKRKERFWIYCMASLIVIAVSYSRIFVGVHYPSDVLGGALLGTAWALGMGVLFTRFHLSMDNSLIRKK